MEFLFLSVEILHPIHSPLCPSTSVLLLHCHSSPWWAAPLLLYGVRNQQREQWKHCFRSMVVHYNLGGTSAGEVMLSLMILGWNMPMYAACHSACSVWGWHMYSPVSSRQWGDGAYSVQIHLSENLAAELWYISTECRWTFFLTCSNMDKIFTTTREAYSWYHPAIF